LCHTIQHRAVLIIFPLNLQTVSITLMLSSGGEGEDIWGLYLTMIHVHLSVIFLQTMWLKTDIDQFNYVMAARLHNHRRWSFNGSLHVRQWVSFNVFLRRKTQPFSHWCPRQFVEKFELLLMKWSNFSIP